MTPYVETDCKFTHGLRTFEAGGAVVTPERVTAYLGKDGVLQDWHGTALGTYRITATWPIRSHFSDTMNQVKAEVGGVTYTGRSLGIGMSFNGKRKARQKGA